MEGNGVDAPVSGVKAQRAPRIIQTPARVPARAAGDFDIEKADAAALADLTEQVGASVSSEGEATMAAVIATRNSELPPELATYVDDNGATRESDGRMIPPEGWGLCGGRERVPTSHLAAHAYYTAKGWRRMWKDDASRRPFYFYWSPLVELQQDVEPFSGAAVKNTKAHGVVHIVGPAPSGTGM